MDRKSLLPFGLGAALALLAALPALDRTAAASAPAPFPSVAPTPISSLPFTISQPGTYCVTQDLVGVANQHGIDVNADGVIIDLGGYELVGVADSLTAVHAIPQVDLVVRNGRIRDWGDRGVTASGTAIVEDVKVRNCGGVGIFVGPYSILERCYVDGCGEVASMVNVRVGQSSEIVRCSVVGAFDNGVTGIDLGAGSAVRDSKSSGCSTGIHMNGPCAVTGCYVENAAEVGIALNGSCLVEDNIVSGCGVGIRALSQNVVRGNVVSSNLEAGLRAASDANRFEDNMTSNNTGAGIELVGKHNLLIGNNSVQNLGPDFVTPLPNTVGAILSDFGTIQGNQPQANFRTPLF
ncbi:MAG: right-handed parallel beta-helix repeat-containing protein [Planctomycetota bacterium]